MRVWIGLKRDNRYVLEWTDDIERAEDVDKAIGRALAQYNKTNTDPVWGLNILVDKL